MKAHTTILLFALGCSGGGSAPSRESSPKAGAESAEVAAPAADNAGGASCDAQVSAFREWLKPIRERLRQGRSARYRVPGPVLAYIEQHGLYRPREDTP